MVLRAHKTRSRELLDIENDSVKEVSEAQFREELSRKQRVYQPSWAPIDKIRLWDNIEGAWTNPLNRKQALEFNLLKVVARCSVCTETSTGIGGHARDIPNHIKRMFERAEEHNGEDAKIMWLPAYDGSTTPSCSACGQTFRSRPHLATKHMELIFQDAELHKDAVEQTVRRFSLEPPVLTPSPPVKESVGPELQQVERSPQRRRRKRSRGRKREIVHG